MSESPTPSLDDDRRKVVDAAWRCFERFGPQRTSMADIADEAGISRRTLYRVFDDRSSLVETMLNDRLAHLGATRLVRFDSYPTIEDSLVEGSLSSIELAEADVLLSAVIRHEQESSVERFLLRVDPVVRDVVARAWRPALEAAEANGRLRRGVDVDAAVDLIMTVQAIVLMRDDLDRASRRDLLAKLLVPAVLRD